MYTFYNFNFIYSSGKWDNCCYSIIALFLQLCLHSVYLYRLFFRAKPCSFFSNNFSQCMFLLTKINFNKSVVSFKFTNNFQCFQLLWLFHTCLIFLHNTFTKWKYHTVVCMYSYLYIFLYTAANNNFHSTFNVIFYDNLNLVHHFNATRTCIHTNSNPSPPSPPHYRPLD